MAIGDYLSYLNPTNYNVFGVENPTYSGLLGPEQSQALSQRSNIAGLLGAAAALAQGMSKQGPRRSGLQNVIGALGAGYGSAGQAYQGGIEQMANAQRLAQMRLQMNQAAQTQQAIEGLINDPRVAGDATKIAFIRANPAEALKILQEQFSYEDLVKRVSSDQAPQAAPAAAPVPIVPEPVASAAVPAPVSVPAQREYTEDEKALLAIADARIAADPSYKNRTAVNPQQAVSNDVPVVEVKPLGEMKYTDAKANNRGFQLISERDKLEKDIAIYSDPRLAANKRSQDILTGLVKRLELNTKSLDKEAVASYDWTNIAKSVPKEFGTRIANLKQLAETGAMSANEVSGRLAKIEEDAAASIIKKSDFTSNDRRVAAFMFPNADGTPRDISTLNAAQLKLLDEKLARDRIIEKKAGAPVTKIDMGQKTVAIERAKAQVASETAAEGALAVAGDVRAIVDVLKPYQGGKFDELKASLGPYFPGTNLEKISSAAALAEALRAKIAPTLRVPGSGATSDFEMKQFMAAIPSLAQYPQGRELLATYTQRFADRSAAAADIKAKMIEDGTYSLKAFQNELKNAGYERILTPEDLQKLNAAKPSTGAGSALPPDVRRRYGLQ